jgi:hypothetical protein
MITMKGIWVEWFRSRHGREFVEGLVIWASIVFAMWRFGDSTTCVVATTSLLYLMATRTCKGWWD